MLNPPILTLTTDFGQADFHLGRLKGHLLARRPDLRLVDISHEIPNYDIVQAAFIFRKVWRHYPKGTIHLLSVNDYYQPRGRFVALEHDGQFFVGPDNGIFSLIFGELPEHIRVVEWPEGTSPATPSTPLKREQAGRNAKIETSGGRVDSVFDPPDLYESHRPAGHDSDLRKYKKENTAASITNSGSTKKPSLSAIYAYAVGKILDEGLESVGKAADKKLERIPFQPVIGKNYIRGSVVFIDKFDNALTNISRELFERVGQGRGFSLQLRRNEPIDGLSFRYQDVPEGEPLIKFNSDDELEIAINLGKAAGLMSIAVEDAVQVDFF